MERIQKTFEIDSPVHAVYSRWTQFEDFPRFMEGVKEVRQLDETHLRCRASVAGKDQEWEAEITEQVPDQRIAWRSTSGAQNAGTVRFEPMNRGRTRVMLSMEYEPEGLVEKSADAPGLVSHRVEDALQRFKRLLENAPDPDRPPAHGPGGTMHLPGSRRKR